MTEQDPYAVLGVPVHADPDTIAGAYRDLARRHHPDVSAAPDAERRMAAINAAWATLRDPARRAAWDRAHLRVPPSAPAPRREPVRPSATRVPPAPRNVPPAPRTQAGPAAAPAGPTAPAWRRGPHGEGAAGPPPGPRRGSVLPFGRHIGWSLGEIARVDPGYLVWLKDRPEGARYRPEIEQLLATLFPGPRAAAPGAPRRRRLPFR